MQNESPTNNKICKVCLTSNMLCSACNSRLESGQISDLDVKLSRAVFAIRPDAEFSKYIVSDNFIIIIADKDNARKIIGKAGRNVQTISKQLNKKLKVVEISGHNVMLEELLSVPIIAINKVYQQQPDASGAGEFYRVRIDKKFSRKVRFSTSIASAVLNKKIEYVFE
ncbi:MAG: hypothetical protein HY513_02550 [Candidatus Aenigmarchaeota archaeon]|nr:hypothetical protein [Candidatus Aenigmarchaeota archaeon]